MLVREPEKKGDEPIDITLKNFYVRTVAQESGGGDFTVFGDNNVIFANNDDQRLYQQSLTSLGEQLHSPKSKSYFHLTPIF